MQTRDQWKGPRNWKVVASVAAASALGLTGIALAGDGGRSDDPEPITLDDTTSVTQVTTARSVPTTVAEAVQLGAETASVSSPPDDDQSQSSPVTASSPDVSSPSSPDTSPSSPDQALAPQPAVSDSSPDSPQTQQAPASPVSQDSPASPASQDSPGSADSG